jgi:mono/diheme cytochrome c family protein
VRQASIDRYATERPPVSLEDAAVVREGARAFSERGCTNCHGAPGVLWSKFSEGLRPDPPDLKEIVGEREPRQLFWVIKNGIKMTGMPSFGLIEVPDREIWTIVAFLKKLPTVSEDDFKAWSAAPGGNRP